MSAAETFENSPPQSASEVEHENVSGTEDALLDDAPIELSFGTSKTDNYPSRQSLTMVELEERFRVPDTERGTLSAAEYHALRKDDKKEDAIRKTEKNGENFCLAVFGGDGRRAQENIEALTGFVLDFDSGRTTWEAIERRLQGVEFIAYTTYSHRPGDERWRVVVPYKHPVEVSLHDRAYEHFQSLFEGDLDRSCKSPGQIYFTPACPRDVAHEYRLLANHGVRFDPMSIPSLPAPPAVRKSPSAIAPAANESELRRLKDALEHLDPDPRDLWIEVGMAIKHDIGDAGFKIWKEWSKRSLKYDEDDADQTWDSLEPRSGPGAITLGTIYFRAREGGWKGDLGSATPAAIAELNTEYFIAPYGNKVPVFHETIDPVTGAHVVEPMQVSDFVRLFSNRQVPIRNASGETRFASAGDYWLKHPARRQFKGVIFAPGKDVPGYYNRWRGFGVVATKGSWKRMRWHIYSVICRRDRRFYRYLLNWMALAVQRPSEPGEVAVVLRGGQGAGKGLFVRSFGKLFGPHFLPITNPKHLTGSFNGHLEITVVLFVDEGFWAGDKAGEGTLKGLVTEPNMAIERKGFDVVRARSCLHILMASNSEWVIPAARDDRRFFVLDVDESQAQNHTYFTPIYSEMENGGYQAMLFDLQRRDISRFNVRQVPQTKGLGEQKLQSLDPVDRWWFEKLIDGEFVDVSSFSSTPWGTVQKSKLYADYVETMKQRRVSYIRDPASLGKRLHSLVPNGQNINVRVSIAGSQVHHYALPPLADCRVHFEKYLRLPRGIDWNKGEIR